MNILPPPRLKLNFKKKSLCLKKKNDAYGQSSYSLTGSVTNSKVTSYQARTLCVELQPENKRKLIPTKPEVLVQCGSDPR